MLIEPYSPPPPRPPGIATVMWLLARQYAPTSAHIEWGYCLDVHFQAWLPCAFVIQVVQFLMAPLLLVPGAFARLVSVLVWSGAMMWYAFLVFLVFSTLGIWPARKLKTLLW